MSILGRFLSAKCSRCAEPKKECLCGNHAFELGMLSSAVGRFLHAEPRSVKLLGKIYRDMHKYVPGQWCNGCEFCPPVKRA